METTTKTTNESSIPKIEPHDMSENNTICDNDNKNDIDINDNNNDDYSFGWTDEQFEAWLLKELQKDPLHSEYSFIFEAGAKCMTKWRKRYRGDRATWKRIFQKDRVMKEFVEAVPIIDAVYRLVTNNNNNNNDEKENENEDFKKKYTIVDLASGKGYLSMLLSELLPPERVEKFVLIDKAWPQHNSPPLPHHISWTHIYGSGTTTSTSTTKNDNQQYESSSDDHHHQTEKSEKIHHEYSYYDTWPIPLNTSKQDLKHRNQRRNLQQRYLSDGPVIMLAVHLCGTLSLKAVEFFNENPTIQFFCLKPCCLPGMIHAKRHEVFQLGKHNHTFDAKLVCMAGKWKKNRWHGPPRTELKSYFAKWANNLYLGINNDDDEVKKIQKTVMVQSDGGYQNEFLFAERLPQTVSVWDELLRPAKNSSSLSSSTTQENNTISNEEKM